MGAASSAIESFAGVISRRNPLGLGVVLVALLASGCATTTRFTAADTAAVDRLLGLIGERLEVAPEVARVKWNTGDPIEDVSRERQIIDGVARRGAEYGLDSAIAGSFFRGQIEASKTVQTALHAKWSASRQPPFAKVRDLDRDIRPMLDRLTPMMMRALVDALPVVQRQGGRDLLDRRNNAMLAGLPEGPTAVRQAVAPLRRLSR
jgi:chorismate mutase